MLASLAFSALLAGPVAAGLIVRQNTVTVTSISTSTIFAHAPSQNATRITYSPASSFTTSIISFSAPAATVDLNPINGLPAVPPRRPDNTTTTAHPSTTFIKPIVFTSVRGSLTAIYKSGPVSTFTVPSNSSEATTKPSNSKSTATTSTSTSVSTPLSFHTFTPTPGRKITITNSGAPEPEPTPTSSRTSSTSTRAPTSYSSLQQAPPQFPSTSSAAPSLSSSKKETVSSAPTTTTSTVSSKSTPTPSSTTSEEPASSASPELTTSSTEEAFHYPYPTKEPKTSESSESTEWSYPYPSA